MLVSKKHKAVVLNVRDPAKIFATIPTAKPLDWKGHQLVAVPYKLDETKVLRNLGAPVPSPINYLYDWSGEYKPFDHQRETAAFCTLHERGYILNDIGTGKTLSALWAADYLMQLGVLRRVLILSPLSTLERVWGNEIFTHLPHRTYAVLHGTAEKRKRLLKAGFDFYIINHEGFRIIADEFREDTDLLIIDELARYRNAAPTLFKPLKKVLDANHWVWGMTGSPTPESPSDAWAQCQLVTPGTVPKYFTSFKNMVMQQVSQFKWIPRPEAAQIVHDAMQPAIRFKREECLDLPPCTYQEREAPMSAEQKRHYKEMTDKLFTEVKGGGITAVNEGVKAMKLVQAACGVFYGDDGGALEVDCKARIEVVKECIEEAGQKVIVFVPFTATLKMLERELSKHWTVAVVNGDVGTGERNRIFTAFQGQPDPHVLVAHPGCMSHGLTLTEANTIVWYAPINSHETYEQANGRITRAGQKYSANVIHIEGSEIERRIYKRLKEKGKMQGILLDMAKEATERRLST